MKEQKYLGSIDIFQIMISKDTDLKSLVYIHAPQTLLLDLLDLYNQRQRSLSSIDVIHCLVHAIYLSPSNCSFLLNSSKEGKSFHISGKWCVEIEFQDEMFCRFGI